MSQLTTRCVFFVRQFPALYFQSTRDGLGLMTPLAVLITSLPWELHTLSKSYAFNRAVPDYNAENASGRLYESVLYFPVHLQFTYQELTHKLMGLLLLGNSVNLLSRLGHGLGLCKKTPRHVSYANYLFVCLSLMCTCRAMACVAQQRNSAWGRPWAAAALLCMCNEDHGCPRSSLP